MELGGTVDNHECESDDSMPFECDYYLSVFPRVLLVGTRRCNIYMTYLVIPVHCRCTTTAGMNMVARC